jgi:biopolymer transport protein ExbD
VSVAAVAAKRRRRKSALMVPTASMGDIAFLLIIFFMVCSNFMKEANVLLEPPRSPQIERIKESMVSVSVDQEARLYLNGKLVQDAVAVEYGVRALIENARSREGRIVMFKCDQAVDKKDYEPVLDAIAKAGGIIAAVGEAPRRR